MSSDQSYPFPQVFVVDRGGGTHDSAQTPNLIPCWSFPPAQERVRRKRGGCLGISYSLALILLLLFLLVFAALGFEAYQIMHIQKQLRNARQVEPEATLEFSAPQKQIGVYEPEDGSKGERESIRPAAHLIERIETNRNSKTLRWEHKVGQAFAIGGVVYQKEDGALRVNETGLYHVYSRVELIFKNCHPTSSFEHSVFVRREGDPAPLTLMNAHRAGFCPQHSTRSWTTENYLGSAHQLKKHDKVYVNISHPEYLSQSHYGSFFGLYKI
ncbi:tumor necrosis factor ligand superfamily member 6 [Cololabis saira]|uniref:tumor necrosis factor ligand superfamily member 6 n=1 Tax=Cololabis saira TaxID=129043 RepID=UPI002AD3531E|nr:tumor necrosis factor ligand superfamily member 6 [Cololabis saira]